METTTTLPSATPTLSPSHLSMLNHTPYPKNVNRFTTISSAPTVFPIATATATALPVKALEQTSMAQPGIEAPTYAIPIAIALALLVARVLGRGHNPYKGWMKGPEGEKKKMG